MRVVTGSCVCLHSRQACVFACDVSAGTSIIKWALLLPSPPVTWQVFWFVQCVRTTCVLKVFLSEPHMISPRWKVSHSRFSQ